jgi:hypothetical protein
MIKSRAVIAILGFGAVACNPDGTAPTLPEKPTAALVSLVTPNADDGAVVVTLKGPDLSTITAASSGYVLYSRFASAQEARVIVVGNVAAGALVKLTFGAGHALSAYSATVEQVAARNDTLRASLVGYQLTFAEAPALR